MSVIGCPLSRERLSARSLCGAAGRFGLTVGSDQPRGASEKALG
jgi:hypothetical protein